MSWARYIKKGTDARTKQPIMEITLEDGELQKLAEDTRALLRQLSYNLDKLQQHPAVGSANIRVDRKFKDPSYIDPYHKLDLDVVLRVKL